MGDPFADVFGPLAVLRDRIGAVVSQHGLHVDHVGFVAGPDTEGPHEVQILLTLGPLPEEVATNEEFERVIRDARTAEIDRRSSAALDELRDRLRGGGGFLDDPTGDA